MTKLPEFRNEPYTDFTLPENRSRMEAAMRKVKAEFGKDYDLLVSGERISTPDKLKSVNPSRPSEIIGSHSKASPEIARKAIEKVHAYFPVWAATSPESRVEMLMRASSLLRDRKLEFDAWLCYEAGKTWPEAEAEVAEAMDFCEYYAREMVRFANPPEVVQMAGERDEMRYLAAGRGHRDSAMEFRARDSGRDGGGRVGHGKYGHHQALERNADRRREVRGTAARSRIPAGVFLFPAG